MELFQKVRKIIEDPTVATLTPSEAKLVEKMLAFDYEKQL